MKPCKYCLGTNHQSFQCFRKPAKIKPSESIKSKTGYIIPKISKSRSEGLKLYKAAKKKYFLIHPVCEFPGCSSREVTLHHMKGRIGELLYNIRFFKSLCQYHHTYVENNPAKAKRMGLSMDRL